MDYGLDMAHSLLAVVAEKHGPPSESAHDLIRYGSIKV